MKSNSFKATYCSWLKTHDKSHKEYQRRKRYPWHIISGIEFSEELVDITQKIYNKNQILLGDVVIKNVYKRSNENKIQFDFQIFNNLTTSEFRIVFLTSGKLITIFDLGKDLEKYLIKKYLLGENVQILSAKLGKLILLEFVWRKLKDLKFYEKQRSFEKVVNKNLSLIQTKKSFIVDISKERELWIFVSLFEYEANSIEIRYSSQCNKIISLFIVHNKYIPNKSTHKENIISVREYLLNTLTKKDIEILNRLQNDIMEFAKFK